MREDSTTITVSGRDRFNNITTSNSATTGAILVDNGGALSPDAIFSLLGGLDGGTTLTKSAPGVVNITTLSGTLLPGSTQVTFTESDTTGPTLVSVFPAQNATDVAITTPLFLDFSEVLKVPTVTSANIQLVNALTSETVPATVSLDEGGTRVRITPNAPLDFQTQYYFQASSAVTDEAGNALTSDVSSETTGFTTVANTADVTAPTVVSVTPSDTNGIAISVIPFVDFSESMKASTLTPDSVQLRRVSDNSLVSAVITVANGGTRAVITPDSALAYNTSYYVFVDSTVADEAGNALGGEGFTADSFQTVQQPGDERAPIISNIQVTSITTSSAIITWNTDEAASSQVEFGLTSGYGSMTDLDSSLVTEHSVLVSDLGANSTYHFRVRSADEAENEAVSGDNTFSTLIDDSATLDVTQITAVRTFATADDTFANGWKWIFDVTVPTNETEVFMKFSDFVGTPAGSIPAANNVRFYSEQSSNAADASSSIVISAANTYAGTLSLNADRNSTTPGRQIQIMVEVKAPVGTPGGSYSASYGIKSQQPEQVEEQPL